jgi:2-methylfumaryl-CoA isomerase
VKLALKDMALAILSNLGIIGEVMINGYDRPKMGNSLYGAYAQDFLCKAGGRVIVVALRVRQWDNLKAATHTQAAFDELAAKLGANLSLEGERFKHWHAITAVLRSCFDSRRIDDFAQSFDSRGVTWGRYRTVRESVEQDPDTSTDNPMFSMLEHPGFGSYLTPGNPIAFSDAERVPPTRGPSLGEHTDEVLAEIGFSNTEVAALHDDKIVAGPR